MSRVHKYGAIRTQVEGITFASKKEAGRYVELRMLERAGEIRDLELQPVYPISVPVRGHNKALVIAKYIADFRYRQGPQGVLTIEDVKGMKTPVYRLKKKLVEAQYGITIREV